MMKSLMTLTAVAALAAGMSIANAQSTVTPQSSATGSGSLGSSVHGSGKFCIKGAGGALNCNYASLSACKKAATGSQSCATNPNASATTGMKPKQE